MATIYIPGDYLHKYSDEEVIMIPKVRLSELWENIEPKLYRKYVVVEKGVMVLYAKIKMIYMSYYGVHFYFTSNEKQT